MTEETKEFAGLDYTIEVPYGVRAKRVSAFGLRSSRPSCPDGMQDLGVPGVWEEGKRPGRYEDAVWLAGGPYTLRS